MSSLSRASSMTAAAPLDLSRRSLAWKTAAVLAGSLFLTLCSYIQVPMVPVPVTLQTFGVLLVGALFGWRLGALTILAWFGEAAIGLPVLAGGKGGWVAFVGPTAGYLFSYPLCAALAGWWVAKRWRRRLPLAFTGMALASLLCLAAGAAWLSLSIGLEKAIALGVTPFLLGDLLKSALVAVSLKLIADSAGKRRRAQRDDQDPA